jgi:hypothetical protein
VSLSKALLKKLQKRDQWCWHCGSTELVPHHRKNRQAGGSKLLDRADNIILVCAQYNGLMESDADVAEQARLFGHKLRSWEEFRTAVFDRPTATWYILGEEGEKWTSRSLRAR